ncbi:MAG: chemotaxis protein MotB [Halioglobus sp.]|jgi:chemotaxis protein MotB
MIEFEAEEEQSPGIPAWMATFADLMSLLMCFFVLLLSFSEMDVVKYKQVAGSMKNAFGVQNQVKVVDIPKGTSIIAQEFSPGKPKPSQIKTINQVTTETTKASLSVGNPDAAKLDIEEREVAERLLQEKLIELTAKTEADAENLREILRHDIRDGKIDIESEGSVITIRIREQGSFPSASATLNPDFKPVMETLRDALVDINGTISVEGHTDNIPIISGSFRSNWGLSSSRALSVTHELLKDTVLDDKRFVVVGHADMQPFGPNDSSQSRAQNRRVEVVIRQGQDEGAIATIKDINADAIQMSQEQ